MKLELKDAIKNVERAIEQLETFIPKEQKEICEIFSKAWYYLAFGIKGLELYFKELN